MRTLRKIFCGSCLLLLVLALCACKVSDDAIAAAQQMTTTAADLSGYYNSLDKSESDTIALNELDDSIFKIPFNAQSKRIIQDTLSEIAKRQEAAEALARLAASMSALTRSTISSDVSTAATALGNELVNVKALPAGPPVPEILGKAGKLLMQLAQQRKEKEAARAMDQTLTALTSLFEKEKPVYDSIFQEHITVAAQVAKGLIKRQAIDPSPMLEPALKPFNLSVLPLDGKLRDTLLALELNRLHSSADDASQQELKASEAMLAALKEMSSRVHLVATEKSMHTRGNPVSLKTVESWVASAT